MPVIRALAVDIDGTLTDKSRVLSPAAVAAMRGMKVPVVLVTGNTHCFTRAASVLLGTPRIFIAENGGVVSHAENDMEILADIQVCEAAFRELCKLFPLERYSSARYRFTDIALKRNFDVKAALSYAKERSLPVDLIDTAYAVHIKDRRVNKGTGICRVATRMQIDPKEFAAVGDSLSDMPMFELAGFRASVGNASPELRAASDYVAEAKYGDGFAEIVKHMIDTGLLSIPA
ncbi:Phosphoglycolate phosphatase [uncultured archaeon]|nr:Phosphoglycolate phosphatase [uncultured archaeon]